MQRFFGFAMLGLLALLSSRLGWTEEVSKEQIKGLDEQVQEIKTDVLGISAELGRLEEKLLYPSDTQVSLFVSLAKGDKFRLDAVEIKIDGRDVAHHLYSFKELEALQKGGVQRIYTGNVRKGGHNLEVSLIGKSEGGSDYRKTATYTINKDVGPKLVEITVAGPATGNPGIEFKDW